ncbi:hypothetical protein D3C86_1136580 [compost metagenome]
MLLNNRFFAPPFSGFFPPFSVRRDARGINMGGDFRSMGGRFYWGFTNMGVWITRFFGRRGWIVKHVEEGKSAFFVRAPLTHGGSGGFGTWIRG